MTAETVRADDNGGLRRIWIDRPDKANAFTAAMMHRLAALVRDGRDAGVGMIVLQGVGARGFSAGADIAEFLQGGDHLQRQDEGMRDIFAAFVDSPLPIAAAIHGRTLGAGVLISALSDLVIAADDLSFGLPEIRFNMYPVMVQAALEEKISSTLAFQLCVTGRLLDATEARTLGLVTDIVPAATFDADAAARVAFYLSNVEALTIGRRALRISQPSGVDARIARLAPLMHENFARPGVRETIARYFKG